MNRNFFILHGHFYQPPRENPWSGYIDRQVSAAPFSDWNARILEECYSACAYAPILEGGQVSAVINCYEYISFNFGPTLLEWMDRESPKTVQRIIDADRISSARNYGHGNAIAQVFNHMIMPLANAKDQYTQALWGLADFRRRFGRDSEGLWLGETAINDETAAILVDCGVKFVVLSPYQALSVIENGQEHNAEGANIDTGRAYRLPTKNGDLSVFFYDGPMASGISFGDLLQNAAHIQGAVRSAFGARYGDVRLVHTATDGEVYGHHKSLGNMALARFIDQNTHNNNPEFTFTNYGAFLEEYPPLAECRLIPGKDGRGSAWSCSHGVGRWHEDCSCHTGGLDTWNQKWRTPLRDAFNLLRDAINGAAETQLSPLLKDIWAARNDYYTPYTLKTSEGFDGFFLKHQKKTLGLSDRQKIVSLMEGLRFAMLMYTSCGWFFSDISGIETIQDLLYAQRAYEYFKPYLAPEVYQNYTALLGEAQSNIPSEGTGKDILQKALAETKITDQTLRHYFIWQIARRGDVSPHPSYITTLLHHDAECALVRFSSFTAPDVFGAYLIREGALRYAEFPSPPPIDKSFWEKAASWQKLEISNLPPFLRLRSLSHSISYEKRHGFNNSRAEMSMPSAAFIGLERHFLPDENTYISLFLNLRIASFSGKAADGLTAAEVDDFHKSISLYKQKTLFKEGIEYLAKLTAGVIYPIIEEALRKKDAAMLKSARVVLWEIKDDTPPSSLLRLQDAVYRAYLSGAGRGGEGSPEFHSEFQTLRSALNFCKE